MFKVAPTKVDAPELPVVVKVIAFCLLLKVVKSAEAKYPFTEVVAAGIDIVPLVLTKGELKVKADCFALNIAKSVANKYPSTKLVAAAIEIAGVVPHYSQQVQFRLPQLHSLSK